MNSYATEMIADILTVGCCDKDIQGELLTRHNKINTLNKKFDLKQAHESVKRTKQELQQAHSEVAYPTKVYPTKVYPTKNKSTSN